MDRDNHAPTAAREGGERDAHDIDEKTPLLEKTLSKPHDPFEESKEVKMKSHLIHILLALTLISGIWFAQRYYPVVDPRPYAVCARRKSTIYTVDPVAPTVQCFVVNARGRIADIGSAGEIKKRNPHIRFEFIPHNAIIVPGLVDSHAHLLEYGWAKVLDLSDSQSVEEVVSRVREYILAHPDIQADKSVWIEGVGWDQSVWGGGKFPIADDLDIDPVLRGRPIILYRKDLHVVWISPRALELTVPRIPEKVEGGEILRDASGKPTGIFLDMAIQIIPVPIWSESRMREYFHKASKDALSVGLTGVHDARTLEVVIDFYKKLADEKALSLRMYLMANRDKGYWGKEVEKIVDYGNGRLNVRSIKLIADGALGSWGAKMYQPYNDNPSTGIWRVPLEVLKTDIPKYIEDGWQVNVHCIGDEANGRVLDILQMALNGKNATELRPRIEHAQIIRPQDLKRFAELGIIASMQPTHATSDMWYAKGRLGERLKGAYAVRTMMSMGARITLGSDFPVESHNPLYTFYAAVTRLSVDGDSPHGSDGWHPEEKLTRAEALKGLTLDPAFASFSEHELGSLTLGKRADFVILDRDIMKVPTGEILQTKVLATVLDGIVEFGKLR